MASAILTRDALPTKKCAHALPKGGGRFAAAALRRKAFNPLPPARTVPAQACMVFHRSSLLPCSSQRGPRPLPPKPSLKVPGRGAIAAAVFAVFRANRRSLVGKVLPAVCANSGGRSQCSGETGLVALGQPYEAISRESHKPFKGAADNTKGGYQLKIFDKTRSGARFYMGRRCGFCRNRRKSTGPALHRGKIRRELSMELF